MPRATDALAADRSAGSSGRVASGPRRFASPVVRAVLRRRIREFLGLALALAGLALLLALASHDPADPSLNTATDRAATNLAGPVGALVSDLLLQGVGFAALLPVLCLLAWAWRLASHRGLDPFAGRVAALLAALPLLAAVLTLLPLPASLPVEAGPGGAAGPLVARLVVEGLSDWFGPLGTAIGHALLAGAAAGLGFVACGLTPGEWRGVGRAAARAGRHGVGLARLVLWPLRRRDSRPARASPVVAPRDEPTRAAEAPPRRPPALLARAFGGGWWPPLLRRERRGHGHGAVPLGAVLRAADAAAAGAAHASPAGRHGGGAYVPPEPPVVPEAQRPGRMAAPPDAPRVAERAPDPRKSAAALQPSLALEDGAWRLPPLDLLAEPGARRGAGRPSEEALQGNARLLESVLEDYGVRGRIVEIRPGPVVTLYELEPAPGTKSARVIGLADDIARSMSVLAVRIATVPGRNVIGIELPNARRETVFLRELLESEDWARHPGRLNLALGKDIGGAPVIADLARMPHLLIAGTTGSGKSVAVNTMILSLLYRLSPDECRFIMIDPKMLELSVYDRIPHLLAPVVTEPPKAIGALKWTVREMERRYRAMSQLGVRNIAGYNEKVTEARRRGEVLTRRVQTGFDPETGKPVFEDQPLTLEPLPMIVVVIDEMADLMIVAGKEIEAAVQRLAQMARAAGIHVIMATQRPSVDVITGTIKANFPTRISFQVTSKIDSRTILGEQGAEQLLGQGDMLHMAGGGRISRVHGPFVSDAEVERVVAFLREQGEPSYVEEVTETDEEGSEAGGLSLSGIAGASEGEKSLFDQAVRLVTIEGKASTSFLQRHLQIGYNRAAKLIEQMEKEGIVGPANHVGKREVLARRTEE
ncbi:FtsK/SpoIIIE family DNA translocase [Caldovatus sediminis]|nr:DNA translocase FtsK 4TM domain-containing protein [Caldovatus sediminis]